MSQIRRTAADEPFLLVRTSASNLPGGSAIGEHLHPWHQLVLVASGLMTVRTEAGSWIAPPGWAVWVPAGTRHSIRIVGESALRTAWLKPEWRDDLPERCSALPVPPLLRELVLAASDRGMLDGRVTTEAAMAELIAAEIRAGGPPAFTLPEPTSAATIRASRLIAEDAPEAASIAALARAVGLGTRTFERRFRAETGMTPGRWRQQRLLLGAVERIAGGASVKGAADAAGYAAPSAFVAAFRKAFGTTPGRWFTERSG